MADEKAASRSSAPGSSATSSEGGSFWTVMLDPEGNEFCVLRGPEDGWSPE
jgi:predicted enzyme related to lactoylglutathione lyase